VGKYLLGGRNDSVHRSLKVNGTLKASFGTRAVVTYDVDDQGIVGKAKVADFLDDAATL
jgi:hypothetical protein